MVFLSISLYFLRFLSSELYSFQYTSPAFVLFDLHFIFYQLQMIPYFHCPHIVLTQKYNWDVYIYLESFDLAELIYSRSKFLGVNYCVHKNYVISTQRQFSFFLSNLYTFSFLPYLNKCGDSRHSCLTVMLAGKNSVHHQSSRLLLFFCRYYLLSSRGIFVCRFFCTLFGFMSE